MPPTPEDYKERLKSLFAALYCGYAARLLEAQLGTFLHQSLPDFIYAAEGATFDAALFLPQEGDEDLPNDMTARLFETLHRHKDEERLIALDFKSLGPKTLPMYKGGLYALNFGSQAPQKMCAAMVVVNYKTPHLVALIPQQLLKSKSWEKGKAQFYTREMMLTDDPWEPFPMEWQACVMPMQMLPAALEILRDYTLKKIDHWYNPYTKIIYEECDRPTPLMVSLLKPVENSTLQDHELIQDFWRSFKDHGSDYEILRASIQPSVGDFLIRHKPSGVVAVIEVKQNVARVPNDDALFHLPGMARARDGKKKKYQRYFAFTSRWDFLLTTITDTNNGWFVFVRRDELPIAWFTTPTEELNFNKQVMWRPDDKHFLSKHMIRWNSDAESVVQFSKLLDSYQQGLGLQIQDNTQFNVPQADGFDSVIMDNGINPDQDGTLPEGGPPLRGTGTHWARKLFEGDHAYFITQRHQDGRYGRLFQLGSHPIGSWAYVRYGTPNLTFSEVHPAIPIVFVNFASINLSDQLVPDDARHPKKFERVTLSEGGIPSIYILVPQRGNIPERPGLNYFMVSSTALATPARTSLNEKFEFSVSGTEFGTNDVELVSGEMIDAYAVPNTSILPALCSFFDRGTGMTEIAPGHSISITDSENFASHISTKREAARQLFRLKMDLTRLGVRSKGQATDDSDEESVTDR